MTRALPVRGCFVAGTDTEIGKTSVSAALLHLLAQQGERTAGLKPVAAGTTLREGVRVNDDVQALRQASSLVLSDAEVGPCQFEAACSPHIAAALEGRPIDRLALPRAAQALAGRADWLVVEGVGGFRAPLGPGWDAADLACDIGLPVLLVVGLRLGCLNHALLTADAITGRGLRLAGWVANRVDATMAHVEANLATLHERLPAPCLGVVPRLADPTPAAVAAHLDPRALRLALSAFHPSVSA